MSFTKIHANRINFIKNNQTDDFYYNSGSNEIMISAPHGVSQVRLGKNKIAEKGALAAALYLKEKHDCYFIAKTKNNFDDANFDLDCPYKKKVSEVFSEGNVKYLLDFHGLAAHRECDVNLGTHLGNNIETDPEIFDSLVNKLTSKNFIVSIDQPYMGGKSTVSGYIKDMHRNSWTIQIEIKCSISNNKENFDKFQKLLDVFSEWIEEINTKNTINNSI